MEEKQVKTQKFIVKFFPEIMIKGSSAKRQMVGQLYSNIQLLLKNVSQNIAVRKFSDKIEVVTPFEIVDIVREKLIDTPGIEQILEALQFDNMDTIDKIKVKVNEMMAKEIENKTFVVRAKRSGTHAFKSTQIEQTVGGHMLHNNTTKGVDLHNPEVTIKLELINNQLNIITDKYKGLSGFPLGTQGDVLSLMSGGFDSTVASYMTMKRGLKTHFVFFNLGGVAHEIGVKQVAYYIWSKFSSSHKVSFISVPFDDVVSEIFKSTHESYMGVMLKRLMLKASEKIADEMEIDALVTGESVAQVSSQTLRNLALIDKSCEKLILRPLCTVNKPEIMSIAANIGTQKFAETMPEYCGVISKNPVICGSFKRVEKEASKFDYSVLDEAVSNSVKISIDKVIDDIKDIGKMETVSELSPEHIVVDIRQSEDCIETSCETIKIPFHRLKNEFPKLAQDREYLFYCDKGVLSQLHAQYLTDEKDYKNIKVYRPK